MWKPRPARPLLFEAWLIASLLPEAFGRKDPYYLRMSQNVSIPRCILYNGGRFNQRDAGIPFRLYPSGLESWYLSKPYPYSDNSFHFFTFFRSSGIRLQNLRIALLKVSSAFVRNFVQARGWVLNKIKLSFVIRQPRH